MDPFSSLPPGISFSLVGFIVLSLLVSLWRGWIWVKPSVDELKSQHKLAIEDRDRQINEWRDAYRTTDERNDKLAEQIRELVQVAYTSNAVIESIPRSRYEAH